MPFVEIVKTLLRFVSSNGIGNFGDFLAGLTIVVIVADLVRRRGREVSRSHAEKIQRTFSYIERLGLFYRSFYFYNISQLLDYSGGRKRELRVYDLGLDGRFFPVSSPGSAEVVRRNVIDIFVFLREVASILKDNEKHKLVDSQILTDAFSSYSININSFFKVAFWLVASRQIRFGTLPYGYGGDFSQQILETLKKDLEGHFPFIT